MQNIQRRGRKQKRSKRKQGRGRTGYSIKRSKFEKLITGDHAVNFSEQSRVVSYIPGLFRPKSVQMRLSYADNTTLRTVSTNTHLSWTYRSSAYDPDPSLGTGAIPGFVEWAVMYNMYRVVGIGIRGTIANPESSQVSILAVPYTGGLISVNGLTVAQILDYEANPLAISRTLGSVNGNSTTRFNKHWTGSELVGEESYLLDDLYTSVTNTNPTKTLNLTIGAFVLSGANFVTGILSNLIIDFDVEFYSGILLTT